MRKLLLNVVSVLVLSTCVSSCSKDNDGGDGNVTPITEEEAPGLWVISEKPVIDVIIKAGEEGAAYQREVNEKLDYLFKKDDKYQFSETSDSCKVIRGASVAPYPKTYKVDGKYLILDGYIKFITDKSSEDKLTLKAGIDEIREIIQVELVKPEYGHSADMINSMLKFVQGEVRLVLSKTN